jgi:hypothetical protein
MINRAFILGYYIINGCKSKFIPYEKEVLNQDDIEMHRKVAERNHRTDRINKKIREKNKFLDKKKDEVKIWFVVKQKNPVTLKP